jgi:hypothetical protein
LPSNQMDKFDDYFLKKEEPIRSCLLALRKIIESHDDDISTALKYGMPFFSYKGKMFCYLWIHKKNHLPYIGIVEGKRVHHPDLIMEGRARMKIMLFDQNKDLPVRKIKAILKQAIDLYKNGEVKIPPTSRKRRTSL